jgi:hypothetical protein
MEKIAKWVRRHTSTNGYNKFKFLWYQYFWIFGAWYRLKWKGSGRIFCISYQKTGTTSVADFFRYFGYPVAKLEASWIFSWPKKWYNGHFEAIFKSIYFRCFQVFEDDPWFYPEFYKYLFHKFPKAKFVLFTRDSENWFNSMLNHNSGKNLGIPKIHCKVYQREKDFNLYCEQTPDFKPSENTIGAYMDMAPYRNHYKNIYDMRNREVVEFFKRAPERLFVCELEDMDKWQKMGAFFDIKVPKGFEVHSNKTPKSEYN